MVAKKSVAVVGAGLGGLTAAGFLQREGFEVAVYEQCEVFSRVGAGIILSANAMKVLRRLDVETSALAAGLKPDAYVSRAWDSGDVMYKKAFNQESEAYDGGPYINIHRGDLHGVLARVVEPGAIRFGHRLRAIEETSTGVRLTFENGESARADLLIGADGVRSLARDHVLGREPPRFVGALAQRAIFSAERLKGFDVPDCVKWWGPDRHILPYFLTSRRDELYVIGVVPADAWESDAASLPSSRAAMLDSFAGFHDDLLRILDAADDVSLWPIFDRPRDDRWSGGRVVLTGDACHPMRPYMAAGGAMAIEDGAILARCLASIEDHAEAFATYALTRIPRVAQVQRISVENSWMRGPTETDWFYRYDACKAPLLRAA